MSALFSPITIQGVTLKNRIVMSPMCMYSCMDEDGILTDWHRTHYISRAVGQVGLIMLEASAVTPQGRISNQDLGIWGDEHIEGLKELVTELKKQGSKTSIQLAHAGRKAEVDGDIIAPSAIAFSEKYKTPQEMTKDMIKETVQAFVDAAGRAKKAGFDVIEIHGAHGYLINQFLSPLTNHRTDEYGKTKEGRYLFLQQIIDGIKEVWSGPLFVRISAEEYAEGGNHVDDYVEYAKHMKEQGVHLIDCSSGAVVNVPLNLYPGYQVPLADQIKKEAGIATGAVGAITTGLQAEEILQNERADLIFIARQLLKDPYWARTAAKELEVELEAPIQYSRVW
ncbi:NADPH dehydrogenase NamA [Longirhabdus pacifica]|uniref:NADPH dehydrogenase NamA n=1 Tax=Longirhabdus pacifica TaxID=2305227 RepID=UPI0010090911|nr:NADPH dehydrogenase NamA [Longirhabdus pacifica]